MEDRSPEGGRMGIAQCKEDTSNTSRKRCGDSGIAGSELESVYDTSTEQSACRSLQVPEEGVPPLRRPNSSSVRLESTNLFFLRPDLLSFFQSPGTPHA